MTLKPVFESVELKVSLEYENRDIFLMVQATTQISIERIATKIITQRKKKLLQKALYSISIIRYKRRMQPATLEQTNKFIRITNSIEYLFSSAICSWTDEKCGRNQFYFAA